MRTATGLTLIAIGAILAFAVTASPPFLNLQIAGWVLMLTGIVGMLMPTRSYGWLRRKLVWRRGPGGPVIDKVEEISLNPGASSWPSGPGDEPPTLPGLAGSDGPGEPETAGHRSQRRP